MIKTLATLAFAALILLCKSAAWAQCDNALETCAQDNPGSMEGFTLVSAAIDNLTAKGGKLRVTLYKGSVYRFLGCEGKKIHGLMMVLTDDKGKILANNLNDQRTAVFRTLEVKCSATGDYILFMQPQGGTGCAGVIYSMKAQ